MNPDYIDALMGNLRKALSDTMGLVGFTALAIDRGEIRALLEEIDRLRSLVALYKPHYDAAPHAETCPCPSCQRRRDNPPMPLPRWDQ